MSFAESYLGRLRQAVGSSLVLMPDAMERTPRARSRRDAAGRLLEGPGRAASAIRPGDVDRGRPVTFTWFDPPFRPEPPHRNQACGSWARVKLLCWDPHHEVDERWLVRPEDFLQTLTWGSAPTAAIIRTEGLKAGAERSQR